MKVHIKLQEPCLRYNFNLLRFFEFLKPSIFALSFLNKIKNGTSKTLSHQVLIIVIFLKTQL